MARTGLLRLVVNDDYRSMGDLQEFETWMRSWGAAHRTIRDRVLIIAAGQRVWGADQTVTTADLVHWLGNPNYAPWTRVAYYYHAKSYFRWLVESHQIEGDPTTGLKAPRQPADKPRPLTEEEAHLALSRATGHVQTWLLLGLLAGLRSHEMAKLHGRDIDERSIFVIGKGNQSAFIPTHERLWQVAQCYPRDGYWFPSRPGSKTPHVAATSVSTMVTRLFQSLGIEGSLHRCRHSYATNLLRNGENIRVVQTLLRHDSLSTTAKYTAVDEDERARAISGLVA